MSDTSAQGSHRLRKPQVKILQTLVNAGYLTRRKISDIADIAQNTLCPMLGAEDIETRRKAEIRGKCLSLVTLGYVEVDHFDIDGLKEVSYAITSSGANALDRHFKELAEKEAKQAADLAVKQAVEQPSLPLPELQAEVDPVELSSRKAGSLDRRSVKAQ